MAALSDYLEAQVCAWIKGTTFAAAPATLYVSLHNGSPTDTGTGGTGEVTTTIRAAGRPVVTFGTATDGAMASNAIVDFGNAAGAATISHFGVWTAASGGNMLFHGALTGGSQAIAAATAVSFASGQISFSIA